MLRLSGRRVNRSAGGDLFLFLLIAVVAAVMTVPLIYTLSNAFKPLHELWVFPPRILVRDPTLRNFRDLFAAMNDAWVPFSRYLFNTVYITLVGTFGHVILSSMCAYAICKLRFRGSRVLFRMVVLSLMFSSAVTAVPSFLIFTKLGLVDTYAALILPAFSSPLGLYLMKQFMESMVNDTLLEAARIDGAGNARIFRSIVMPMVKPAWLTLIIFCFQNLWNIGSTNIIFSEERKTINFAIAQISAAGISRAGTSAAATVIMMTVPIAVFILTQSNIVQTMATSGMKD